MGSFDEKRFAIAYNDIDYCTRARARGWGVIWTPHAQLIHHESVSRGSDENPARKPRFLREQAALAARHRTAQWVDQSYNPNLTRYRSLPAPRMSTGLPEDAAFHVRPTQPSNTAPPMTAPRNPGVWVRHAYPNKRTHTYIVVGLPRSGTSMVAGCLNHLGLFVGKQAGDVVFEDVALSSALETGDLARARHLIRYYNARHDRWAWKRPAAWKALPRLLPLFRNPRLIVPFRDVLAISMRNRISVQTDVDLGLVSHTREYLELLRALDDVEVPTLMVSYEKALLSPAHFLDSLIDFCGLSPGEEAYRQALGFIEPDPTRYLERARFIYVGQVAPIVGKTVSGWAAVARRAEQHVTVELRIDGEVCATTVANRDHPPEDGMPGKRTDYGFSLSIPRRARRGSVIDITIPNSDITIPGSGQIYTPSRKRLLPFGRAFGP